MNRIKLPAILAAVSVAVACGTSKPQKPETESPDGESEVRELRLSQLPPEAAESGFLAPALPLLRDAIARIDAVTRDEDAKGLFLRLTPFGGGFGRAEELHRAVQRVRSAGKPVHCHFEQLDNVGYYFAARSCDRLSMTPAGDLNVVGVAAQLYFVKALLDRIGVKADLLQVGRYKGAADPFTEETLPESTAESLNGLLDDFHQQLLTGISESRDIPIDSLRAAIDRGPFSAAVASELAFIDHIAFVDEARQRIREAAKVKRVRRVSLSSNKRPEGLLDLLAALTGEDEGEPASGERLVVASLTGTIVDGEKPVSGSTASGPFVRAMKRFRDDDEVKAVVLRIHSPGGSALASDRMWHAVHLLAQQKPVIVSVGDIAASGGYYVASAGDTIIAPASAIVGSIGVVGGKIAVGELARRSGVGLEVLRRGAHSAWATPAEPFSESERRVLFRSMTATYDRFLRRIEAGRGMSRSALEPLAEGRIWSGSRASEGGLVDTLGTLFDALQEARKRADLPEYCTIEVWPREQSPLDALTQAFGEDSETRARRIAGELTRRWIPFGESALAAPMMLLQERTLTVTPYLIDIH